MKYFLLSFIISWTFLLDLHSGNAMDAQNQTLEIESELKRIKLDPEKQAREVLEHLASFEGYIVTVKIKNPYHSFNHWWYSHSMIKTVKNENGEIDHVYVVELAEKYSSKELFTINKIQTSNLFPCEIKILSRSELRKISFDLKKKEHDYDIEINEPGWRFKQANTQARNKLTAQIEILNKLTGLDSLKVIENNVLKAGCYLVGAPEMITAIPQRDIRKLLANYVWKTRFDPEWIRSITCDDN